MKETYSPDDIYDDIERANELMDKINEAMRTYPVRTCVTALLKLAALPFVLQGQRNLWNKVTKSSYTIAKNEVESDN
jgi:hypothetical protein